jgi:hypothetical protein
VISARDEIWIDMVQFDVRAADQLWEGIPPAHGAPGWYDDVSGLIETASGPAEPHELVDEPVVVEDMHETTLGGPRHCRHRWTLGRVVAMKAVAASTASVLGVAAAAAATTGIVATVARVVVPVIEEHVLLADDDDQEAAVPAAPRGRDSGGTPDTRPEHQATDLAAAPPAAPATPASPDPADPEPAVASASPAPTAPTAETRSEPATDLEPPAVDPGTDLSIGSGSIGSASTRSEPAKPPRVGEPPAKEPPPPDVRSDKGRRWSDKWVDADACARHACSGPGRYDGGGKAVHRGARATAVVELVKHGQPAHPRRG